MEFLEKILDPIKQQWANATGYIRRAILGQNNEKLDLLVDSFYRLSPQQRMGSMVGAGVGGVILVFAVIFIYYSQSKGLEKDLNNAFNAMYELGKLEQQYRREEARFDQVVSQVRRRTAGLRVKPFFEDKAQTIGVNLQGLRDQTTPLPSESPLAKRLKYVKIDMKSSKGLSIPRLLKFITEVEKSNKLISIEDLRIQGRYGTKLYFDTTMKFRTYTDAG